MSSYSTSTTQISDLRQAAEGEVISGPQSQLALPGGFALGEGATVTITGTAGLDTQKTFEQMASSQESTLAKVLGLTNQLAAGIFEQSSTQAALAAGVPGMTPAGTEQNKFLIMGGLALLAFIFFKGR